jgi:mannosyl-oligosaccharide alpha-1,2-mannosidase
MNVRDPFNIRTGSLNRPPIATWKSNKSYNAPNNLSPLHHIIRTAATATQSAAADIRDKAGEVVQSAQQALTEATTALNTNTDLEKAHPNPPQPNPPSANPPKQEDKKEKDMSFTVPKNVPSFTNPQRQLEDHLWAASSSSSRQRSTGNAASAVLNNVQDFISPRNPRSGLPMYKDKPYMYPPGRGPGWSRPLYRRKRTCGFLLLVVVGLVWWMGLFAGHRERAVGRLNDWGWLRQEGEGRKGGKVDWLKRRERVVEAMELSWDAYERYAWGGLSCPGGKLL